MNVRRSRRLRPALPLRRPPQLYGAMIIADGDPAPAWEAATKQGQVPSLLRAVPQLPSADLRGRLSAPVTAFLDATRDPAARALAITALGATRADAATFERLAQEILAPPLVPTRPCATLRLPRCCGFPSRRGRGREPNRWRGRLSQSSRGRPPIGARSRR